MAQNYDISTKDFVRFTAGGLSVASFVEIRNALINKYKAVYGQDIDLSTGTADGVFVNDLALIINNIVQAMQTIYSNLNVNTASAKYLDNLCALSNVTRKSATRSNVSLQVTNNSSTQTTEFEDLTFVDRSGNEWYHSGTIQFDVNETKQVYVVCKTPGAVKAPAGWIDRTLEVTYLTVTQENDANIGSEQETDSALRARRNQSVGAAGTTVLESMVGSLLNISGVDDVKIYNNNSAMLITANDGTAIDAHSIYVIIRKQDGVTISDETIGTIIHDKLTPGIHSCKSLDETYGIPKSYTYVSELYGQTIPEAQQNLYWKEAIPEAPEVNIEIKPLSYFTTDEFDLIANSVMKYMNSLELGKIPTSSDIMLETLDADPKFRGNATYTVLNVTISTKSHDSYYKYTKFEHSFDSSANIWTLKLS